MKLSELREWSELWPPAAVAGPVVGALLGLGLGALLTALRWRLLHVDTRAPAPARTPAALLLGGFGLLVGGLAALGWHVQSTGATWSGGTFLPTDLADPDGGAGVVGRLTHCRRTELSGGERLHAETVSTWGPEGPPAEAYERITNPERFRGLHQTGRDLLDELAATYQVRRESFLDQDRPRGPEPAERLVPDVAGASPLALTYTEAPGLVVRFGHGQRAHIPICACDACDETHDSGVEQVIDLVDPVVAGTFGETLTLTGGTWTHHTWSASGGNRSEGSRPVDDEQAEQLLARMTDGELTWQPWTRRRVVDPA